MILKLFKKVFIGFEKGKAYSVKEIVAISIRRGVGIGIILFFIFLSFQPPSMALLGGVTFAAFASVMGLAALD